MTISNQITTEAERFKKEHRLLLLLLFRIQTLAVQAMQEEDAEKANRLLLQSKQDMLIFLKSLDVHAKWEEEVWYPLLRAYCEAYLVPHAADMLDTVEEDHSLAQMSAELFLRQVDQISRPAQIREVQRAAVTLNKTCCLLWEHFSREEELMEPAMERAL